MDTVAIIFHLVDKYLLESHVLFFNLFSVCGLNVYRINGMTDGWMDGRKGRKGWKGRKGGKGKKGGRQTGRLVGREGGTDGGRNGGMDVRRESGTEE